uniref:Uncharacterized protein n=1 Tax=Aegilops tauschii subsp. strangulata TaxID=200361 RepID=A0A453LI24_AEGTS
EYNLINMSILLLRDCGPQYQKMLMQSLRSSFRSAGSRTLLKGQISPRY